MPFGKYDNMAACVADNQDKENPEAYCAALHKKITGKTPSEMRADMSDNVTMEFEAFKAGDYSKIVSSDGSVSDKGVWTTQDIIEAAESVNNSQISIPVFRGHLDETNPMIAELADGKVEGAVVDGDVLKFKANVTREFADWWKQNRLLSWSVRIMKNYLNKGKTGIAHVAALGKSLPQLKEGLKYKPVGAFSENNGNGYFITFAENERGDETMTLEEALVKIEELKKELAAAKKKAADMSEGDEKKKLLADVNEALSLAATAEAETKKAKADFAEYKAGIAALKRKADFAEIEAEVEAEHKAGLPKSHADHYRVIAAAKRGLVMPTGAINFAEGKEGDLIAATKALAEVKRVPMKTEAGNPKQHETTDFSDNPEEAIRRYNEAVRDFAESEGIKELPINAQRQKYNDAKPEEAKVLQAAMRKPITQE